MILVAYFGHYLGGLVFGVGLGAVIGPYITYLAVWRHLRKENNLRCTDVATVEQLQRESNTLCHICGGVDGIVVAIPVLSARDLEDPMNPEQPPDLFTCQPCRKLIAIQDWTGLLVRSSRD